MFRLGARAWTIINVPGLTPRTKPVFSQIDSDHLCLLGGDVGMEYTKEAAILNHRTGVVRHINLDYQGDLCCFSQSYYQQKPAKVLSLIEDTRQ